MKVLSLAVLILIFIVSSRHILAQAVGQKAVQLNESASLETQHQGITETSVELPEEMIFSYVDHPTMVERLIPITRAAYEKLGISTRYVIQPSNRNLRFVDDGSVDGDVGYMKLVIGGYPNVMPVPPAVVSGIFVLLCAPSIDCEPSLLTESNVTVAMTSAIQKGIVGHYGNEFSAKLYIVNNISVLPELLKKNRVRYAIYATSPDQMWRLKEEAFNHRILFDANVYHIINRKYAHMQHMISKALAESIAEFYATEVYKP